MRSGIKITVTRSATEGSNSGRFLPPVEVVIGDETRTIVLRDQARRNELSLWPEDAKKLGLALIESASIVEWR